MSGVLRAPGLTVYADGAPLPGVMAAEVVSQGGMSADRFSVHVASSLGGRGAWDGAAGTTIEIRAALDGADVSLVTGQLDALRADAVAGVLVAEGRNLAALLIDARTSESFANQTASDVAATLAARHGLDTDIADTTTPVGRYYSSDHTRITLARQARASTEWDLLAWLATQEGYDLWVSGRTLNFQPASTAAPVLVLQAAAPANVTGLQLRRVLNLANGVNVTVRSWNTQTQQAVVATSGGGAAQYVLTRPNLSQDAAQALADRKVAVLLRHQFVVQAQMPGELALSARDGVTVTGTGSVFDQDYSIDRIVRRVDAVHGFTQVVQASSPG